MGELFSGLIGAIIGSLITAIIAWYLEERRYKREIQAIYRQKRENAYLKYIKLINKFYYIFDQGLTRLDLVNSDEEALEITQNFENEYLSISDELELYCSKDINDKMKTILYNHINKKTFPSKEFNELIEDFQKDLGIEINKIK